MYLASTMKMKMKIQALALLTALSSASAFVAVAHSPKRLHVGSVLYADFAAVGVGVGAGAEEGLSDMGPGISGGAMAPSGPAPGDIQDVDDVWDMAQLIKVEGETLRTCSFSGGIDRVLVGLRSEGRPVNADVELWQGPDNTPQIMAVYIEEGNLRPFTVVIETPMDSNAIAIRNTGMLEFPLEACLEPDIVPDIISNTKKPKTIQGDGAVMTTPLPPSVQSVSIELRTDGRPLKALIELLQGPNNRKTVCDVYCEDGKERPFLCVIPTPGNGNILRIKNTATLEYPIQASAEPYLVDQDERENWIRWDS